MNSGAGNEDEALVDTEVDGNEDEAEVAGNRRTQLIALASFVAIGAIIAVIALLTSPGSNSDAQAPQFSDEELQEVAANINDSLEGLPQYGYLLGEFGSPARLLVFASSDCPQCTVLVDEVVPAIADMVSEGDLQVELQPLVNQGAGSQVAVGFAIEMGNTSMFWNFLGMNFELQNRSNNMNVSDAYLHRLVNALTAGGTDAVPTDDGHNHGGPELIMLMRSAVDNANSHGVADADLAILVTDSESNEYELVAASAADVDADAIVEAVRNVLDS